MIRLSLLTILISIILLPVLQTCANASSTTACGTVVSIDTHDGTTTRYSLSMPTSRSNVEPVVLLLLPGGGGFVDLDSTGCARGLKGNYLVRSIGIFNNAGFITALADAPSDHHNEDGLAGFRSAEQHAADLGRLIMDLRTRTKAQVWILGTSRGTISAVNAATRLSGRSAPDGVVLTSAVMSGQNSAKKPWVSQTVFDLPLETIRQPLLVVGHIEDKCVRSPADQMARITDRTNGIRQQLVTITGGPGKPGSSSITACEGRSPHGFLQQEKEVIDGIARFIRNGRY